MLIATDNATHIVAPPHDTFTVARFWHVNVTSAHATCERACLDINVAPMAAIPPLAPMGTLIVTRVPSLARKNAPRRVRLLPGLFCVQAS